MLVAMNIYHRSGVLMKPDYLSCLGADLCFDELTCKYLNYTSNLRKLYPPITGTKLPENMPGYRGPVVRSTVLLILLFLFHLAPLIHLTLKWILP